MFDSTLLMLTDNNDKLLSLLENIQNTNKIIICNLKWNSETLINTNVLESNQISIIDIENEMDLIPTLNHILHNFIKTEKILLFPLNKIEPKSTIQNIIQNIGINEIYIKNDIIGFYYDKEFIKNIFFRNINHNYKDFINELLLKLNYKINAHIPESEDYYNKKVLIENEENTVYFPDTVFIVNTKNTQLINQLNNLKYKHSIIKILFSRNNFHIKLFKIIKNLENERIVIIDHYSKDIKNCLDKLICLENNHSYPSMIVDNNNKLYIFNKKSFFKIPLTSTLSDMDVCNIFFNICTQIKINDKEIIKEKINDKEIIEEKIIEEKRELKQIPTNLDKNKFFMFIIPFMYNGDRFDLFEFSLKNLKNQIKKSNVNAQILIHETSKKRFLTDNFIKKYADEYLFTYYDGVFNRAWNFNVATRYCNLPDNDNIFFIFFDGDIIIDKKWISNLNNVSNTMIGWNVLYDISKESTKDMIDLNLIDLNTIETKNTRYSDEYNAAGGISIINKNIFFQIKGFPEYFSGTWGCEDNAFMKKLKAFGYKVEKYEQCIWHLFHSHQTHRSEEIRKKWHNELILWNDEKWIQETENLKDNWGIGKKVSIAMINYLRENKLIQTLKTIKKNSRIPLDIVIQLQGKENLNDKIKQHIVNELETFKSYEIIWNDGNLGTATPRYNTTQKTLENKNEYTIIIDSDMIINNGTLELLYNKIENNKEYGAISCWCKPNYYKYELIDNKLNQKTLSEGFHETDALGTGCVIVKTEIFKKAKFNTNLIIGFIDFIWCLEIKNKTRYKLGIICDNYHKILNDASNNSKEYMIERTNKIAINKSRKYIKDTWNINI